MKFLSRLMLCALILVAAGCNKNDDPLEGMELTPSVVCHQAVSGTAMKGEKVTVSAINISENTVVTVKYGTEKTLTRTGPGVVSYAFEKSGSKTITVTMEPEEVEKQRFKVVVEKLDALQVLAQKLKTDPQLCLVMAHRGNSSDFSIPENSHLAVEKCVADNVDIMEMDLYTTKDGVLVVSHDADLSRETTGSGSIASKTLEQIKSYNLKDRNGKATEEKMLTFDELLVDCKGRLYVNVDLGDRTANVVDVVNTIAKHGMTQQVLVYCNSAEKINTAFKTNPECNVYSWVSNGQRLVEGGLPGNYYFTQCEWKATKADASKEGKVDSGSQPTSASTVANALSAGTILTVNAIYTTNTKQLYADRFTDAQIKNVFEVFPACQCIHVDTGAQARQALINAGKHVLSHE